MKDTSTYETAFPQSMESLISSLNPSSILKNGCGREIAVVGCHTPSLLQHIEQFCPELHRRLEDLRGDGNLFIDLSSEGVWRGAEELLPVEGDLEPLMEDLRALDSLPKKTLTEKGMNAENVVVILGAGKGTRMADGSSQKVCAEIGTRSVTQRALEIYKTKGFTEQVLVVGHLSDLVVRDAAGTCPETTFVLQTELLGTGHAAKQAMYLLEAQGYKGNVLVVAGDKVIAPEALQKLSRDFAEADADLMLTCAPKDRWPTSGRVAFDKENHIAAIVEAIDVKRMGLIERMAGELDRNGHLVTSDIREWIADEVPNERKVRKMFPPSFLERIQKDDPIDRDEFARVVNTADARILIRNADGSEMVLTADEVESRCQLVNVSVYLFKAECFYYAIKHIKNHNAQQEYYLTDIVEILRRANEDAGETRFKILPMELDDSEQALGFNTEEELQYVRSYLREKTIQRLRDRGVIVDESAAASDIFWVDDLDSIDKIGEGTRLTGDVIIDLGPDPAHRIGRNCTIENTRILREAVPDGTTRRGNSLQRRLRK